MAKKNNINQNQSTVVHVKGDNQIFLSANQNNYILSRDRDAVINATPSDRDYDYLIGVSGRDTLVGAAGTDRFVLGKIPSVDLNNGVNGVRFGGIDIPGEVGKEVYYDEAGNEDYALIQNFDRTRDSIEVAGGLGDYRLGASPAGLPQGTGIFVGDELIAIVEGQNDLSLNASYFQDSIP
ncbi:MAG: hypothetical protein ACRC2R_00490 [Xenococcaceae cyanobacterium]